MLRHRGEGQAGLPGDFLDVALTLAEQISIKYQTASVGESLADALANASYTRSRNRRRALASRDIEVNLLHYARRTWRGSMPIA